MRVAELAEVVGLAIRPVQLVEIDHIGLQPAQAGIERGLDVASVEASLRATHVRQPISRPRHLGRQDHAIAAVAGLEPAADKGLGTALGLDTGRNRVHLGRVDEVDTCRDGAIELGMGLGLGILLAEGHGPQTECADLDVRAAESSVVHAVLLNRI